MDAAPHRPAHVGPPRVQVAPGGLRDPALPLRLELLQLRLELLRLRLRRDRSQPQHHPLTDPGYADGGISRPPDPGAATPLDGGVAAPLHVRAYVAQAPEKLEPRAATRGSERMD